MINIVEKRKQPQPNSIQELVIQALMKAKERARLAENLFNPSLVELISSGQTIEQNNQPEPREVEGILLSLEESQRDPKNTRVWILTQAEANEIVSQFNSWDLAKNGIISAQTSYNSGKNLGQEAINETFGVNGEDLHYYRKSYLPEEILNQLPDIFKQIETQDLPNCSDPLSDQVENKIDHSRLMVGDIVLIPHLFEEKIVFKTVHFIIGDNTEDYCEIRKKQRENKLKL